MSKPSEVIGHPLGAAAVAALTVLLVGLCVFGFRFTIEEKVLVGLIAALAGFAAIADHRSRK